MERVLHGITGSRRHTKVQRGKKRKGKVKNPKAITEKMERK